MIYIFVAVLLFGAVATLVAAMAQRRREQSDQALRERVGTIATLPVPAGYERISTEGLTVLPGLWDLHVHMMYSGHPNPGAWFKHAAEFEQVTIPASAECSSISRIRRASLRRASSSARCARSRSSASRSRSRRSRSRRSVRSGRWRPPTGRRHSATGPATWIACKRATSRCM